MVSVVERASRAVGTQPAASSVKSIRRIWGGAVFQRRKNYSRPGDRIEHVEALEGGGSVKLDQVPRGKLWRVIKSAFICFCQAGDDIALFCIIGDDLHPCRRNYYDGPISSRARQLNRDIVEVPRLSDRNVVNAASSMMRAPLIKSGPCSGKRAHQHVYYGL